MASSPNFFIVTSHGWSGSFWLAHSLNKHPDVICSHSAENLLAEEPTLHTHERHKKTVRSLSHAMQNRQSRPIDEFYDDIEELGAAKVYGSVHVFRLRDLPIQQSKFGIKRSYQIVNLVRHPMSFIWSGYGQLRDMFEYDVFVLKGTLQLVLGRAEDYVFMLAERHGLNLCDFEVMSFLGACANLYNLRLDIEAEPYFSETNCVQMEKLTCDVDYYRDFVSEISKGQIDVFPVYLDEVFSAGRLNEHRHGNLVKSPAQLFTGLSEWQQDAVRYFMEASQIRPSYESFGYDFSFLD